ncbi:Unknown protein sequence [Pseudomonas syringae pv. maculicola]|nr:Unknown protein sequence [Pseudomonas syringae pv. maculicola]
MRQHVSAEYAREDDNDADNFSHRKKYFTESGSGTVRKFLKLFFSLSAHLGETIAGSCEKPFCSVNRRVKMAGPPCTLAVLQPR